jgi:fructokinase
MRYPTGGLVGTVLTGPVKASAMSVLVAGETLVDFIPETAGGLADVESFTRRAGGSTANVSVALARLGHPPSFWTRVGDDAFGDFLADTLEDAGVPTARLKRDPEAKTSLAFVSHAEGGDRGFSIYRDRTADTRMRPGAVDDDALATTEWVHVGGVTLTDDPARTATYDLAERATAADCTVSFDPNARPGLWDGFDYVDSVERMLDHVDVVMASRADLATAGIDHDDPHALARTVCDRGPHTAFVTMGGKGAACVATDEAPWGPGESRNDGYAVEVVDATGAGDAFTAGAVAALQEGSTVQETVAFASAVGALATTGKGAMAALPDREAVRAFRERQ